MQLSTTTPRPDPAIGALVEVASNLLGEIDKIPESIRSALAAGATLGELRGITAAQYESLYDIAYGLCDQGCFLDAAPIALQLVAHQPRNGDYAFLAGNCMQRLALYSDAAQLFSICMVLEENGAAAAFRMGECLAAMDFMDLADKAFDAALALSRGDPNARELQDMVFAAMQMFRRPM